MQNRHRPGQSQSVESSRRPDKKYLPVLKRPPPLSRANVILAPTQKLPSTKESRSSRGRCSSISLLQGAELIIAALHHWTGACRSRACGERGATVIHALKTAAANLAQTLDVTDTDLRHPPPQLAESSDGIQPGYNRGLSNQSDSLPPFACKQRPLLVVPVPFAELQRAQTNRALRLLSPTGASFP
uniref:Uncharacterized protein n=1 Tax=Knipowitschia caucasica TaxID=637954 RepID=A0AAV2J4T7_KNICA